MTRVEGLRSEWRRRAGELERLAARGGMRAWLARIRLRILRYLLARYEGEAPAPAPRKGRGRSAFIARKPGTGRPPRGASEMRRLLERIQDAVRGGGMGGLR
ncbi:MAG: hypothetical protein ACYS9X_04225 [Planctomycetota bacterium]